MISHEIRDKFIRFFSAKGGSASGGEEKGHKLMAPSSLIPAESDSSVLFTTAGMQQFKRFYLNPAEAPDKNVVTIQPCVRTSDIEEVGDATHLTFFEMLGNFSFGEYFKERAIPLSFEFFTSKEGLDLDPQRLYVTCFKGDDEVPTDQEAVKIWQEQFAKAGISAKVGERIFLYGREENWWEAGPGPCGPDAEIFYNTGKPHDKKFGETCHPNCDCGQFIEIGNDVFVQYNKTIDGKYEPLTQKSIDNGRGFERLVMVMQGKDDIFETDLFWPIIEKIEEISGGRKYKGTDTYYKKEFRIIADHIKTAIFAINEGILPSNKDRGYVIRRLIRRAIVKASKLAIDSNFINKIAEKIFEVYNNYSFKKEEIISELNKEEKKFRTTLEKGLEKLTKATLIAGEKPEQERNLYLINIAEIIFDLSQTHGFNIELSLEELNKYGDFDDSEIKSIEKKVNELFRQHQEKSRTASAGMFKGGLADTSEQTTKLHTAAHLLLAALRQVLGGEIKQAGSNINQERLRFDFTYPEKVSEDKLKQIEDLVNQKIDENLPITMQKMSLEEAKKSGATGVFDERYGEKVKVYSIGPSTSSGSREICGGPHVENTSQLGHFKITKEESSSAGVRRIKAILE